MVRTIFLEQMRAGDQVVVDGVRIGAAPRTATLLEVLKEHDLVSCLIRWDDDGRELRLIFLSTSPGVTLISR